MLTYEPLKREIQPSTEEIRKHEAAKWNRLAKIAVEMGNTDLAKDAVSTGLEVDPGNQDLMQIKKKLDRQ
jgi:phage shock protein A